MSKEYKTLREIKDACKKVNSCATASDGFMYKCFPFICEKLESIDRELKRLGNNIKHDAIRQAINKMLKELE